MASILLVRLDSAAWRRGDDARVFASATGRIWYTSPTFTAAMPLLRRIWFRSGQRSSRAILPAVRMVTWPSMRAVDRVADAERGGEAVGSLADVGALEVEDHRLFLAERGSPADSSLAAGGAAARGSAARSGARAGHGGGDRAASKDRQHPSALHGTSSVRAQCLRRLSFCLS